MADATSASCSPITSDNDVDMRMIGCHVTVRIGFTKRINGTDLAKDNSCSRVCCQSFLRFARGNSFPQIQIMSHRTEAA